MIQNVAIIKESNFQKKKQFLKDWVKRVYI